MDAFYASVEQRDNPALKGKPLVVAGDHERGVVAAASYEARKFGVKSAMSSVKAKQLCPELVFVHPRLEHYKKVSQKVFQIFTRYSDVIEPLSLDEAFIDVTTNKKEILSAQQIAIEIRSQIKKELNLNASAGVSYNKFLAKIASDVNKPNGMCVIPPSEGIKFIYSLPINKFFGIGKVTAKKFKEFGIKTGAQLAQKDKLWLLQHFGKSGAFYYEIARGVDERPVNPNRKRSSVGAEHTFSEDIETLFEIFKKLEAVFEEAYGRLCRSAEEPRTVTLKIKYADFKTITRSHSLQSFSVHKEELKSAIVALCNPEELFANKIRLLGVTFSNFKAGNNSAIQSELIFE